MNLDRKVNSVKENFMSMAEDDIASSVCHFLAGITGGGAGVTVAIVSAFNAASLPDAAIDGIVNGCVAAMIGSAGVYGTAAAMIGVGAIGKNLTERGMQKLRHPTAP
ncbi:MAG: hypothetical protein COB76_06020 [Alphaproteobacteria bacterium]|nr:MAG: hypothetical protein COB76_06020 [Alphaproteobacteria bacterium]